jgi:hypothetical protein
MIFLMIPALKALPKFRLLQLAKGLLEIHFQLKHVEGSEEFAKEL